VSTDPADTGSQSQSLSSTQSNAAYVPKRIDEYLREVLSRNGSDLHFVAGDPPRIRLFGDLHTLREQKLTQDVVRTAMFEIMPRTAMNRFEQKDGADFAYSIPGVSRFRVNVFRHIGGIGGVFRAIPSKALSLDQLNMPEAVRSLCRVNSGLILVTGKTGSGKSTSLAAMIDDINTRIKGHILTIEDPIEFVHTRKNCLVSQREVGVHSPGFRRGAALGPARGPGRGAGRRVARPRDNEHRGNRGGNGHPGNGDAAHERRGRNRRPHRQCVPHGQAGPCAHHAVDLAARRHLPATSSSAPTSAAGSRPSRS
jgi:hypothetical protein